MKYSMEELVEVYRELVEEGVNAVVIGNTCVQLALGYTELEGDLDLFVVDPSPIAERDFYYQLAERKGWDLTTTEIGAPALVVPLREGNLIVELYENYMDIDVPLEILEDAQEYRVRGVRVRALKPEYYLVLKARQGVDLDRLKRYVAHLKERGLNTKLVEYAASHYPEDEREVIVERLRDAGLEL
ncbi:MAG: nucleotidyltransferase [Desulfurococcaceae archaeon]